jgi:hypothetical protein
MINLLSNHVVTKRWIIVSLTICSSVWIIISSCEIPTDLHNPFDPKSTIEPPSNLVIDSVSETSVTLEWQNNFAIKDQNQIANIRTIIMYAYQRDNSNNYIFNPVDTLVGLISKTIVSRAFESAPSHAFVVYTLAGTNTSRYSNIATTTQHTGSLAPTFVSTTLLSSTACQLQWKNNSISATFLCIERKTLGNYILVAQTPGSATTFIDSTITYKGDSIYYRICPVFTNGLTGPYDTAAVYAPMTPPILSVTSPSDIGVMLQIKNSTVFGDGFILERTAKVVSSFLEIANLPISANSYFDSAPLDTTLVFTYRIRFYTGTHISDPSNSINVGFLPHPVLVNSSSGSYIYMAVSPNGSTITLTDGKSGNINLVNSSSLQIERQIQYTSSTVTSVDISNQFIAAGFAVNNQSAGKIRVWKLSDGSLFKEWDRPHIVTSVRFSPDGTLLAADGYDGGIADTRWNLPGSMSIINLSNDSISNIFSGSNIVFSPKQKFVATASSDLAMIWSMENSNLWLMINELPFESSSAQVRFFNDEMRASIAINNMIFLWDISNSYGTFLKRCDQNFSKINCFDITPDSKNYVLIGMNMLHVQQISDCITADRIRIQTGSFSSIVCLSNGHLILGGPSGIFDYVLRKQWKVPE